MGLLDGLAGQVLGSLAQGGGTAQADGLAGLLGALIGSQPGGLAGLIQRFEAGGLGELVQSWVGTGANLPISPEQLHAVLGSEQIGAIASQLGFAPQDAAGALAQLLPGVVDKLTPGGSVPQGSALDSLLAALGPRAS